MKYYALLTCFLLLLAMPSPAADEAKNSGEPEKTTVALGVNKNFECSKDVDEKDGTTLCDLLIKEFENNKEVSLIDRRNIKKVLAKAALDKNEQGISWKPDENTLKMLSNIDYFISGSISRLAGKYIITVKVINITDASVTAAAKVECDSPEKFADAAKGLAASIAKAVKEDRKDAPIK
jgi:TolB-like protein